MKLNNNQINSIFNYSLLYSIAGLIYTQFSRSIKKQIIPTTKFLVPSIHEIRNHLNPNNQLMQLIKNKLYEEIINRDLFKQYQDSMSINNVDDYALKDISNRIPLLISKKFGIGSNNTSIIQSKDIHLFSIKDIDNQFNFIIDEMILYMITLSNNIPKEINIIYDKSIDFGLNDIVYLN